MWRKKEEVVISCYNIWELISGEWAQLDSILLLHKNLLKSAAAEETDVFYHKLLLQHPHRLVVLLHYPGGLVSLTEHSVKVNQATPH